MERIDIPLLPDLTRDARMLLLKGVWQIDGPWSPEDALSRAMGFLDAADLRVQTARLCDAIERSEPLTWPDWHRAFCCAETAALSYTLGIRSEWQTVTGIDVTEALATFKTIERAIYAAHRAMNPHSED